MASWSSPRPWISKASGDSVGSTRTDTLPSDSRSSRSLRCRLVKKVPARPANGEVLTPKRIVRVGDRLADVHVAEPGDRHDLARSGAVQVGARQPGRADDPGHLGWDQRAVALGHPHPVAEGDLPLPQAPDPQTPDV